MWKEASAQQRGEQTFGGQTHSRLNSTTHWFSRTHLFARSPSPPIPDLQSGHGNGSQVRRAWGCGGGRGAVHTGRTGTYKAPVIARLLCPLLSGKGILCFPSAWTFSLEVWECVYSEIGQDFK